MFDKLKRFLPKSKSKAELEEHYKRLEQVDLEKNDLLAMYIAMVLTIVLPLILLITAVYSFIYFVFIR